MIFTVFSRAKFFLASVLAGWLMICSGIVPAMAQQTEGVQPHLKLAEQLQAVPSPVQSAAPAVPTVAVPADIAAPAAGNDIVGEGDQLLITVFGQPDLSADVTVGNSGVITLPLVGTVDVRGKSGNEIATMFAAKLEQGQYLLNPKVSVRISQQVSRSFSVLGEVMRPGRFPLQGPISLFDALSLAGGATARADKTLKLLRRTGNDATSPVIEYATMQLDFDNQKNAGQFMQKVQPNDMLIVGQQKNFYIYGEVRKPGMYPVEEDLNIMRVLSIAGGVTERGSSSRIIIHRKTDDGSMKEIPVKLSDQVLPGDVVFINERIF